LPGRLPVELTENGKKQSKKLCDYFADKNIFTIYSSEVLRCKQTAEIISGGKIPVVFDKRLLEVLNAYQGFWNTNSKFAYSMRKILGGESNQEVQNRMTDFWNNVGFEKDKNYIICSHGDPILFLKFYLDKTPLTKEMENGIFPEPYLPMGGILILKKMSNN
jgi:broad specificity phosphatase PhoE